MFRLPVPKLPELPGLTAALRQIVEQALEAAYWAGFGHGAGLVAVVVLVYVALTRRR